MSKTTFEKLGIPYEERDGIFYPVLVAGTEKADIDVGKYGRMWIKYIKEEYPMRYKSLVRFGELEERADDITVSFRQRIPVLAFLKNYPRRSQKDCRLF